MARPQDGILGQAGRYHYVLEYSLPGEDRSESRALLGVRLRKHWAPCQRWAETESYGTGRNGCCIVAFGPKLWSLWFPTSPSVREFRALGSQSRPYAPSTQRDLLIWLHADAHDINFARAFELHRSLREIGLTKQLEVAGFTFFDSRDLTGFVDGVANPSGEDEGGVALQQEGPHAGGSFVLSQAWLHHGLAEFRRLKRNEQEFVIGRSKHDGQFLQKWPEGWPEESHVGRLRGGENRSGTRLRICRRSFPFGSVDAPGLYFLAFAREQERFEALLELMFADTASASDPLLRYSHPTTGSFWFAPSLGDMNQVLG